jgi:hypothetical protein
VGAGGTDHQVDRAVHPIDTRNPSRSSGEAQSAAGLLTTEATSTPYSAAVPGQCRWRPEGRRDLVRAASTPTVAMVTTPPPAPTRGPTTHEGVSHTPSLSCLDKIRQPRLNLYDSIRIPQCLQLTNPVNGLEQKSLKLHPRIAGRSNQSYLARPEND